MKITHNEAVQDLKEMVLYSYDVVPYIVEQLWRDRRYPTLYVGRSIRALSCTNKFFYNYCSAENNQQKIIRGIVRNNYETDEGAAAVLKFHAIHDKIKYFINIAENKDGRFRQEDLAEKWYLNVITFMGKSLAGKSIEYNNVDKAKLIINHSGLDLTCEQLESLEDSIFWKILHNEKHKNNVDQLKILRCLLDNECDLNKLKQLRSLVQNKRLLRKQNARL